MSKYVRIINHGQICEVMGTTQHGGILLRNPNYGRENQIFNNKAVEPAPYGHYIYCCSCGSPILLNASQVHPGAVCSMLCYRDRLEELTERNKHAESGHYYQKSGTMG